MFAPWLGRFRLFRYEVRCWPGGTIPDAKYAVDSPVLLSTGIGKARRLLEAATAIPVRERAGTDVPALGPGCQQLTENAVARREDLLLQGGSQLRMLAVLAVVGGLSSSHRGRDVPSVRFVGGVQNGIFCRAGYF